MCESDPITSKCPVFILSDCCGTRWCGTRWLHNAHILPTRKTHLSVFPLLFSQGPFPLLFCFFFRNVRPGSVRQYRQWSQPLWRPSGLCVRYPCYFNDGGFLSRSHSQIEDRSSTWNCLRVCCTFDIHSTRTPFKFVENLDSPSTLVLESLWVLFSRMKSLPASKLLPQIATAFIHLLSPAISELTAPCLGPAWQVYVCFLFSSLPMPTVETNPINTAVSLGYFNGQRPWYLLFGIICLPLGNCEAGQVRKEALRFVF